MAKPKNNMQFEIRNGLQSVAFLWRNLGVTMAVKVMAEVAAAQTRGDPWRHLPPPADDKERLSRKQVGPAIVLYKALRKRVGPEKALALTREVILGASILFLSYQVPRLKKQEVLVLKQEERVQLLSEIIERFPNTDIGEVIMEGDEVFGYDVTNCRFPNLCQSAGAPEIAPLLCEGDKIFFAEKQPDIKLLRTTTIAAGGEICDFRFTWGK